MAEKTNYFEQMARRVRAGDALMKVRMQRDLERCLSVIVRAALAGDAAPSPLHRQIRQLAQAQAAASPRGAVEQQTLARTLSQRVIGRLTRVDTERCALADTLRV